METGWEDGAGGESDVSNCFRMMLRTVTNSNRGVFFFFSSFSFSPNVRGGCSPERQSNPWFNWPACGVESC